MKSLFTLHYNQSLFLASSDSTCILSFPNYFRMVTLQEVRRRETAEAEMFEAQGYLKSSRQELGELKHLAWKLEQMGRNRYRPTFRLLEIL